MAPMLPPACEAPGRLAEVLWSLADRVVQAQAPSSDIGLNKAVVVVVDGLGAHSLRQTRGHARFLSRRWEESGRDVSSGLPSTTASSLASITTGVEPGLHGLLGYQIRVPDQGVLLNHLKPYPPGVTPELWQSRQTVFDFAAQHAVSGIAVGESKFEHSDFTRSILRGARYLSSRSLQDHVAILRRFFDSVDRGIAYLYWPALDRLGHQYGPGSTAWCDALEELDSALAVLDRSLRPGEGGYLTADHGMVTVPHEDQIVFPEHHPLRREIALWGGEPRLVQLYLREPDQASTVAQDLQDYLGERATVLLREEALHRRLFGEVASNHRDRVGDVLVFAEGQVALYDELTASARSREMLGHHGSWSAEEVRVPLIPLGPAWV